MDHRGPAKDSEHEGVGGVPYVQVCGLVNGVYSVLCGPVEAVRVHTGELGRKLLLTASCSINNERFNIYKSSTNVFAVKVKARQKQTR